MGNDASTPDFTSENLARETLELTEQMRLLIPARTPPTPDEGVHDNPIVRAVVADILAGESSRIMAALETAWDRRAVPVMGTMIEKCSRAIFTELYEETGHLLAELSDDEWHGLARAAIAALLPPSPEMIEAGMKFLNDARDDLTTDQMALGTFTAMITAALNPMTAGSE